MLTNARQHAPMLVSALVVIGFGLLLAGQINDWLELTRAPVQPLTDNEVKPDASPDLERMATLFGSQPGGQTYAPETASSDLTLLGSFVHADPQRSTAILQIGGSPPQLYRVNDEPEPGMTLQSVHPDRVQIMRNGRLETLYFPTVRSAAAEAFSDYSEQAMTPAEQPSPESEMLQQQMDATPAQLDGSDGTSPNEQPTEVD